MAWFLLCNSRSGIVELLSRFSRFKLDNNGFNFFSVISSSVYSSKFFFARRINSNANLNSKFNLSNAFLLSLSMPWIRRQYRRLYCFLSSHFIRRLFIIFSYFASRYFDSIFLLFCSSNFVSNLSIHSFNSFMTEAVII